MKPILLGTTVYGELYTRSFLDWCLPSLLAPGNLPALAKERDICITVHTNMAGSYLLLDQLPKIDKVFFKIVNDVLPVDKYALLGKHQRDDLKTAKELGADYHCLMPDFIYSDNCFQGILEASKKHKAIARLIMSTVQEDICPNLGKYRYNGALMIPHIDLTTMGLVHIHPGVQHWLAEHGVYPNIHVQAFEMEKSLVMMSPHLSPVFIANEVIKLPPEGMPFDSRLDKITSADIYCPKIEDGIGIIEMSPKNARREDPKRLDIQRFALMLRYNCGYSEKLQKVFFEQTVDPINRLILGKRDYWEFPEYLQTIKAIERALGESYSYTNGFKVIN